MLIVQSFEASPINLRIMWYSRNVNFRRHAAIEAFSASLLLGDEEDR
jgi:hypothetical protein